MATSREERMQQRMRGAQRHQVQDASFDLFFSLPEVQGALAAAGSSPPQQAEPTTAVRTTPNTSAKRRRLNDDEEGSPPRRQGPPASVASLVARHVVEQPREEEVGESPADAPGSGRRRSVMGVVSAAAARRSAALQKIVSGGGPSPARAPTVVAGTSSSSSGGGLSQRQRAVAAMGPNSQRYQVPSSSPLGPRRTAAARGGDGDTDGVDELSPELETAEQPSAQGTTTTGGGMFSKLANAKRNAAAQRRPSDEAVVGGSDQVDELSSPSFVALLEPGENTTTGMIPSSSPLARKSAASARTARASGASNPTRRSTLSSLSSRSSLGAAATATPVGGKEDANAANDRDELSPDQPETTAVQPPARKAAPSTMGVAEVPSSSPINRPITRKSPLQQQDQSMPRRRGRPATSTKKSAVPTIEEAEDEEQAEEVDELEAARTIGRKRPRSSDIHEPSPELGSGPKTAEAGGSGTRDTDADAPAAKRRRRRQHLEEQSPSTQNQPPPPKSRGKQVAAPQTKKKPGRRRKSRADDADENSNDDLEDPGAKTKGTGRGGPPIPITVQRFTLPRKLAQSGGGSDNDEGSDRGDEDALVAARRNPFALRSGVSAVDVLAQVCEDIVEQKLQELDEAVKQAVAASDGDQTAAAAARRDGLVRRRALEAFRTQVRGRLLEQAVALDHLHALRKRVRAVHKQKLALRSEILRVRAERDQVALRMDALRLRHEAAVGQAKKTANLSAAMHDIDLAVEQGKAAPELSAAQQKTAELANLELAVSRIAEQVGGGSGGNGTLKQIQAFNAFLERTAAVLEGRKVPSAKAAAAKG